MGPFTWLGREWELFAGRPERREVFLLPSLSFSPGHTVFDPVRSYRIRSAWLKWHVVLWVVKKA